jgi:hypothetical protein
MEDDASRALAERMLRRYAEDAARLPLDRLLPAARETGFDPTALLSLGGGDVALVLGGWRTCRGVGGGAGPSALRSATRRARSCSGGGWPPSPSRASVRAVRSGRSTRRWRGPGSRTWRILETPNAGRFRAWSVAQPVAQTGFGSAPVMQATMLIAAIDRNREVQGPSIRVGPGCPMCPRTDCAARR